MQIRVSTTSLWPLVETTYAKRGGCGEMVSLRKQILTRQSAARRLALCSQPRRLAQVGVHGVEPSARHLHAIHTRPRLAHLIGASPVEGVRIRSAEASATRPPVRPVLKSAAGRLTPWHRALRSSASFQLVALSKGCFMGRGSCAHNTALHFTRVPPLAISGRDVLALRIAGEVRRMRQTGFPPLMSQEASPRQRTRLLLSRSLLIVRSPQI